MVSNISKKHIETVKWKFGFSDDARDQFKQLDQAVRARIKKKIQKILQSNTNPVIFFKPLTGTMHHLYSLRVGDHRLICQVKGTELIIMALQVGHRRDVYEV
jgi:mRNA interferase RelE/StbE